MDKACITVAGVHRKELERNMAAAAAFVTSISPSSTGAEAGTGVHPSSSSTGSSMATWVGGVNGLNSAQPTFTSKEAFMAAVSRHVAEKGFEPINDVFSLSEW